MSDTERATPTTLRSRRRTAITLGAGLLFTGASLVETGVDPAALFDARGASQAAAVVSGLLHPDLSAAFVGRTLTLLLESVAIGIAGMSLALLLAIPAALGAARAPQLIDPPIVSHLRGATRDASRWLLRGLLSLLRSIPDIVWAFVFVRIVGLGPLAAVLAIGISFAGIIGKLYAEHIEACDPVAVRTLRQGGHGSFGIFAYSILPQIKQDWISYGLFRLECAVRSAAVLGIVGAGGIGAEIELSVRYFQYDKLGTALLALLACMVLIEAGSAWLRTRSGRGKLLGLPLIALALLAATAMLWLDLPWSALAQGLPQLGDMLAASAASASSLNGAFFLQALDLVVQTLAMSWLATLGAALLAALAAPWAVRMLTVSGYLPKPPPASRPRGWIVLLTVRSVLQCLRAVPVLVWALTFVVWLGPGPFAGMLALGVHTLGLLGRLFAEIYEEAGSAGLRHLEASGASRVARWTHGLLPQTAPKLLAYTLFRFEVNLRATATVGFVGAGGIGDAIHTAISLFHFADLAGLLLVLLAAVVGIDAIGHRLRQRLLAANPNAR
jgi:phosphonate transport system permease protein